MAAPTKQGLDYFPFDVDLLDNDDLDFLREKYGVVVNDVYIGLLTLLYRKKGYYIPYETKAEKEDCIWYIYKRVRGGKHSIQQEAIPTVIEAIVAQGLFSGDLFNKIITSERAQCTYYSATVERKLESFDIRPEYWLLDDETMRKLSKKHPYYLYLRPESKSDEKPSKSDEKPSKSDEKPLNKSKVNITSNEVIKKVSKKDINIDSCILPHKRESYQDIIDSPSFKFDDAVKMWLWKFIQHCQLNGHKMTNDRLRGLCLKLSKLYPSRDVSGMIDALKTAIERGYYDIKDGECWTVQAVKNAVAAGIHTPLIDMLSCADEEEDDES